MAAESSRIGDHMTPMPVCIPIDEDLDAAVTLMQKHGVRHLPVVDGNDLAGILSDRDLAIIESLLPAGEWETISVAEAMTPKPYTVSPDADLSEVAARMAERKYGSAVVANEDGRVLGVFTTTDALRVLARLSAVPAPPG